MNKHEHKVCEHKNLKYCKQCDVVYCVDCGKEWGDTNWTGWNTVSVNDFVTNYPGKYSGCLTGGHIN